MSENEENLADVASEIDSTEANSKDNSDIELDSLQVVDSMENRSECTELSDKKKVATRKSEKPVSDEEGPAKKRKLVEVDEDSDDDFAAQLLEGQSQFLLLLQCFNKIPTSLRLQFQNWAFNLAVRKL